MKRNRTQQKKSGGFYLVLFFSILTINFSQNIFAQVGGLPELMHFRFNTITSGNTPNTAPASTRAGLADATVTGLTIGGTGQFGAGLQGVAGAQTSNNVNPGWTGTHTGSWTISFWLNGPTPASTRYMFGNNTGNGTFRCFIGGAASTLRLTGGVPSITLDIPSWTPGAKVITYVYDKTTGIVSAYMNGVFQVSATPGTSYPLVGTGFFVGAQGTSIEGTMDEFRMYNRALSATEVADTWDEMLPLNSVPNDAGVSQFVAPTNFCQGTEAIKVKVKNNGTNIINNVQVQWKLNGLLQTPYNLTLPLDTFGGLGLQEREVTLGTYTFANAPVDFQAWTTLPNNVADTVNNNDTIVKTLRASLSGTYTINSASTTSGTNFQSFSDFASGLNNYGVCGPVTVNVVSGSGPYTESFELAGILGSSAVNKIRINGNSETLQYTGTSAAPRIVTLNGTSYFTINNLKIKSLDPTYGWGVTISGTANHDSIINCTVDLSSITGTSSTAAIGIAVTGSITSPTTGSSANNIYIGNNNVIAGSTGSGGAYYGIAVSGISTTVQNDSIFVVGNEVSNFYYYGIRYAYIRNAELSSNNIHRSTQTAIATSAYGIYAYYCTGIKVDGNKIHDFAISGVNNTGTFYGMYNNHSNNPITSPISISNNILYNLGSYTGTQYLAYTYGTYINFFHNTIDASVSTTTGTSAMYGCYINTNTGSSFKNNIINITGGSGGIKYGFYFLSSTIPLDLQKNNVYINTTQAGAQNPYYYGSAYTSLAAFQTANPTQEIGSPSVDPLFTSASTGNLLPTNSALLTAGENVLTVVPTDINGSSRSSTPTIGAFENLPTNVNDAAMTSLLNPADLLCATSVPFKVVFRNAGSNNITSLKINWKLNGVLQPQYSYSNTLTPSTASTGQNSDTVVLGNGALITGLNTIQIWTSLPNNLTDPLNSNDTLNTTFTTSTFTASGALDTICVSSATLMNLTPGTGYGAATIQWQSSTNGTNWTDIASANSSTYNVTGIATQTQYRAKIVNNGTICYSTKDTVNVVSPTILNTLDSTRCGPGMVTLGASASVGVQLKWYAAATGGVALGTGNSFVTPFLSTTTNFFVEASQLSAAGSTGRNDYPGISEVIPNSTGQGIRFNALSDFTLDSVSVWVTSDTGTILVQIQNSTNTVLANQTYTFSGSGATATTRVKIYIPLNYAFTTGNDYKVLAMPGTTVPLSREGSINPSFGTFTIPSTLTFVSSWVNGATNAANYYYFYNFNISKGCASLRQQVTGTISSAPVVNLGNDTAICAGSTLTLNAGAANSTFTKLWNNAATTQTINVTTAGTYSLSVSNAGCSASDTIVVSVNPLPVVNLGNDTAICVGASLTLNAGAANTAFTKLWSTGATTQSINVTAAGTYHVTVSNGACSKKDTIVVTNSPTPVVNLGNDTSICIGSTLTLNAGTANSSFTKLWSNNATTQTINVTTAGTYSVKVTNGLCSKSDTIVVNILTAPTVNLGNDTTICSGSSKTLSAGTANSSLAKLWSTGQTTQNITVNTAGTYSVTVGSGACATSDTIVIGVTPLPVVNLGNDTAICSGTSLTLNAGTANTTASKLWSTGATTQTINVTTAGSYRVTVTNGLCSKKDTINVSVTQTPIVNLGPDTAFCAGSSIVLNAGNPNYARIWNTGAATQTISVNTTGTYSVLVNNGLCYKSDTIVITENPLPANVDLGSDTSFCEGNSVILDAGNPGMNYNWNTGATTQTIVANTSGTYIVNVVNGFNCSKADTVIIDVDPLPSITGIYVTGSSPSYNFSTINPINVTAFNWNFGDGNTGTGATPLHTYTPTGVDQTYTVTLVIDNECGSDTFKTTVIVRKGTGVNKLQLNANELKLYPNPTQQLITVENDSKLNMKQIKISNILGQEVARMAVTNQAKQTINVANLAAGLYNVTIEFEEGSVNRKLEILK